MMKFNTCPNCQELIKQGKCKADCCGCVPIYANYWKLLKKYIQTNDYTLFKFTRCGQKYVNAITKDFKCVFIKDDFSCAIHHSHLRSDICQKYGLDENEPLLACPHINEDKIDLISNYTDKTMNKLRGLAGPCAVEHLKEK